MNVSLLLHFVRQDLIDRYAGSVLGGAWSFFLPLAQILIFTLVFSKIMGARLEVLGQQLSQYSYSVYLIAGMLPWLSFSNTVLRTTTVFRDKAGLIAKVQVSLKSLPAYILVSEAAIFGISMVLYAVFLLLIGFPMDRYWLLVPLVYLIQQLFAYGLGFGLAVLSVFIRDIREFISIVMQLWFWLTPIVYVVNILPASYHQLFVLNPFFTLVNSYRDVIINHKMPDLASLAVVAGIGAGLLGLSLILCGKVEKELRDFL
ncbi:MAG TPA: ABC transporter permease [Porticoccaceae bacterium]|nr:ABC transporter permease [Porticoccaceae bacterium]